MPPFLPHQRKALGKALLGGEEEGVCFSGLENSLKEDPSLKCIFAAAAGSHTLLSAGATGLRQEDSQATPGSPQLQGQQCRNKLPWEEADRQGVMSFALPLFCLGNEG